MLACWHPVGCVGLKFGRSRSDSLAKPDVISDNESIAITPKAAHVRRGVVFTVERFVFI